MDFRSDNGSEMKGTRDGGDRGGVCEEDAEFEVGPSCVVGFCAVGFCAGEDDASGSATPPGGSGVMFCHAKGSGVVIRESSFPRLGGQVLFEAAVTGGGFSGSGEVASTDCDKGIEVSLIVGVNTVAAMTALSPYKADFGTTTGLGDAAGREGAEEGAGGGGATD